MPDDVNEATQACNNAWPANIKMMFDEVFKRLQEFDQHYDKLISDAQILSNKTATDAQSAANIALLNAVNNADFLAKQAIRHADTAASNQLVEQETEAEATTSDISEVLKTIGTALAGVSAAMQAIASNMATGRPPANPSGS
jgi:hypothetical protein